MHASGENNPSLSSFVISNFMNLINLSMAWNLLLSNGMSSGGSMTPRMFVSLALASLSLVFAAGCTSPSAKKKSVETTKAKEEKIPAVSGTHYTTIVFDRGKSSLSEASKSHLKDLAARAHKNRKPIEEIKILAWSDKEYPDKMKGKASTGDIILASQRAQKIKDYLEDDLKESDDIDAFNMAKRPDFVSKLLRDDEYDVKTAYEQSGTTGSRLDDGSVSYTKASKALVIIHYEGSDNNFN
jgi:hypothetical protein